MNSRCSPPASTDIRCPSSTARRCAWSCHGSTASKALNRLSKSNSPPSSRQRFGIATGRSEYDFTANVDPNDAAPALVAGDGKTHRHRRTPADPAVQRLRRMGGGAVWLEKIRRGSKLEDRRWPIARSSIALILDPIDNLRCDRIRSTSSAPWRESRHFPPANHGPSNRRARFSL